LFSSARRETVIEKWSRSRMTKPNAIPNRALVGVRTPIRSESFSSRSLHAESSSRTTPLTIHSRA